LSFHPPMYFFLVVLVDEHLQVHSLQEMEDAYHILDEMMMMLRMMKIGSCKNLDSIEVYIDD